MTTALIGFTGLVGSTLLTQNSFDEHYNSSNIEQIKGSEFSLVVCAAAPAEKWKANQKPIEDWENISRLINSMREIRAEQVVLVSTVDVYPSPIVVDESTGIDPEEAEPYGRNRYLLEQFVGNNFPQHLIIRLPGLFGRGLKKNFIYDLIHKNELDYTNLNSVFQFYNLLNIWKDTQIAIRNGIKLINMATEPVSALEIANSCGMFNLTNKSSRKPSYYDMRSNYAKFYGGHGDYMYDKESVLTDINVFFNAEIGRDSDV